MKTVKKVFLWIIIFLIIGTVFFIWSNSFPSQKVSGEISGGMYQKLTPFFDSLFGTDVISHSLFRKIAHFGEFCVLGIEVSLLFIFYLNRKLSVLFSTYSIGIWIALTDESIQIFSNRGPMVADVLIDVFGYVTGFTIFCLLLLLIEVAIHKKNR